MSQKSADTTHEKLNESLSWAPTKKCIHCRKSVNFYVIPHGRERYLSRSPTRVFACPPRCLGLRKRLPAFPSVEIPECSCSIECLPGCYFDPPNRTPQEQMLILN